jgi:hypothetical protein
MTVWVEVSESQWADAVAAFDARYGEMERALWCLSVNARDALLAGASSAVLEELVWAVKSWWGVQGVRGGTKIQMARALAETMSWSPELFGPCADFSPDAARSACERVAELVSQSMLLGVPRREYSLASKVLHWLMPWRVPVYDGFVRDVLGVPKSWDHPEAYRMLTDKIFAVVCGMELHDGWMGAIEPLSPLRALDKLAWWIGGGNAGMAAEVRDPWKVVRRLGLDIP